MYSPPFSLFTCIFAESQPKSGAHGFGEFRNKEFEEAWGDELALGSAGAGMPICEINPLLSLMTRGAEDMSGGSLG
jgi:hypothetical protein